MKGGMRGAKTIAGPAGPAIFQIVVGFVARRVIVAGARPGEHEAHPPAYLRAFFLAAFFAVFLPAFLEAFFAITGTPRNETCPGRAVHSNVQSIRAGMIIGVTSHKT